MIKNIVFDMGKVLIKYDAHEYIREYTTDERACKILFEEIFDSVEWLAMDRGVIDEESAVRNISKRLNDELIAYVRPLIENWHKYIPPFPRMEELIAGLKSNGYSIYLLSNTSKRFHEFCVNIPALKHFDGIFISADHKLLKPDLRIFEKFYEEFGLKADECFFVDDVNANIEAALYTGMRGYIYRGDMEKCMDAMRKVGIRI